MKKPLAGGFGITHLLEKSMSDIGEIVKRQVRGVRVVNQLIASAGWVYVMTNPSIPGMVKIGMTKGDVYDRARSLSVTNVPTAFEVYYAKRSVCALDVEQHAFLKLLSCRVNPSREFFSCEPNVARDAIREACDHIDSMIDESEMDEAIGQVDEGHFYGSTGPGSVIVVCPAFAKILNSKEVVV